MPLITLLLIELDFDRAGQYMVSCGEDKNWMIWEISELTFENKGMIYGLHSRAIYSCSWAKGPVHSIPGAVPTYLDLIATVKLISFPYVFLGWR